jgi:hypothetical protein
MFPTLRPVIKGVIASFLDRRLLSTIADIAYAVKNPRFAVTSRPRHRWGVGTTAVRRRHPAGPAANPVLPALRTGWPVSCLLSPDVVAVLPWPSPRSGPTGSTFAMS